jgi:hypothetical protein
VNGRQRFSRQTALWASLVVPSLMIVERLSGWPGVIAHAAGVFVAIRLRDAMDALPARAVRSLLWLTAAAVVLAFVTIYPRVNVHTPNAGGDDDDACDAGVHALLDGVSPYSRRTCLDNALAAYATFAAWFVFMHDASAAGADTGQTPT